MAYHSNLQRLGFDGGCIMSRFGRILVALVIAVVPLTASGCSTCDIGTTCFY